MNAFLVSGVFNGCLLEEDNLFSVLGKGGGEVIQMEGLFLGLGFLGIPVKGRGFVENFQLVFVCGYFEDGDFILISH